MIRFGLILAVAVTLAAPLGAQLATPAAVTDHTPWHVGVVHYGKWLSAALAVTFTGLAAREHANSDDAYRQLLDACRSNAAQCALTPGGTYVNAASEELYQTSVQYQQRARAWLLAGQASLLLTAGLFLADHGRRGNEPGNVPYPGFVVVEPRVNGARVGMRFTF